MFVYILDMQYISTYIQCTAMSLNITCTKSSRADELIHAHYNMYITTSGMEFITPLLILYEAIKDMFR